MLTAVKLGPKRVTSELDVSEKAPNGVSLPVPEKLDGPTRLGETKVKVLVIVPEVVPEIDIVAALA